MRIFGKEITDECSKCGNVLECELFRQGHGIKQERTMSGKWLNARWNTKINGRKQINEIPSRKCPTGVNNNISRRLK